MNQIIEVKIIKRKVNYIATSSLFPQCKGIGKTKKEALNKLSGSISSCISKLVNATLSNVFASNNYTQILLDQTNDKDEQTIAFNLNNIQGNIPRTFLLKVPSFTEEDHDDDEFQDQSDEISELDMPYESFFQKSDHSEDATVQNDLFDQLTLQQKSSQDPDAIVFGFPLNFN